MEDPDDFNGPSRPVSVDQYVATAATTTSDVKRPNTSPVVVALNTAGNERATSQSGDCRVNGELISGYLTRTKALTGPGEDRTVVGPRAGAKANPPPFGLQRASISSITSSAIFER